LRGPYAPRRFLAGAPCAPKVSVPGFGLARE
jgi:hypothetical protein